MGIFYTGSRQWLKILIGVLLALLAILILVVAINMLSDYGADFSIRGENGRNGVIPFPAANTNSEFDDLESELEALRVYAYVSDVSVDSIRISLGLPTKYDYLGPGQSPDFVATFISKAEAIGYTKLKEMVE